MHEKDEIRVAHLDPALSIFMKSNYGLNTQPKAPSLKTCILAEGMPAVLDCQRMPLGILELVKVDAWELNSEMGIEIETGPSTRLGDDYWDSPNKPALPSEITLLGPLGLKMLSLEYPAGRKKIF